MTGALIKNVPNILFLFGILWTLFKGRPGRRAEDLLAWTLLAPIGLGCLMAFGVHVFFPHYSAAYIGWRTSPFQFEVGMADLAIAVTSILAFRGDLSFKAAATITASVFLLGDAVGHVRDMVASGNFAPGNAGPALYADALLPLLSLALLFVARRQRAV